MSYEHQDWKQVVISKPKVKTTTSRNNISDTDIKMIKLEQNNDIVSQKKSSKNFMAALQSARVEKGMTQKELSQRINMPINFIQQCENGKVVPPNNMITKIENILKIKLPRK